MIIDFTKEELEEILECLEQSRSEYGWTREGATAIEKVIEALHSDDCISEFGSLRQLVLPAGVMCDSEGNIIFCKCGKPAGSALIGKEVFLAYCSDCSPCTKCSDEFIYKPPTNPSP